MNRRESEIEEEPFCHYYYYGLKSIIVNILVFVVIDNLFFYGWNVLIVSSFTIVRSFLGSCLDRCHLLFMFNNNVDSVLWFLAKSPKSKISQDQWKTGSSGFLLGDGLVAIFQLT